MSKGTQNFMESVLDGWSLSDDIDDFVEAWHDSNDESELHDFLGMTEQEYSLWFSNPELLPVIITARHRNQRLIDAVNDNMANSTRIAARSDNSGAISALRAWIEQEQRRSS